MKLWRYGRSIEHLGQRYRLDGMLGSGGMAEVCLAWDEREQREVAVKLLKSDDLDQDTLNRFMKEAGQIVDWQHPHILRIYEQMQVELIDPAQGSVLFYIVMEYARGGDLHKRLAPRKSFPLSASFALFHQLCDAVEYAHAHGVIHRDLKPLNILFRRPATGPEEVVLSDFGLAVQVDASHHTFARGGTLAYMAPEQFQGHALPASDIFALGVILYQLCTGRLPFRRTIQDLARVGEAPVPTRPSLFNSDLPPALDEPILRALQELPTERYRSASEFWETVQMALTTSARTFPFLAEEFWSPAGETWPYGGSEQPPTSGQTSRPDPMSASGQGPIEEGPESMPGSLREKQKASPSKNFGLSLPSYSIPRAPNPAQHFASEQAKQQHIGREGRDVLPSPIIEPGTSTTRRRFEPQTGRSQRDVVPDPTRRIFARSQFAPGDSSRHSSRQSEHESRHSTRQHDNTSTRQPRTLGARVGAGRGLAPGARAGATPNGMKRQVLWGGARKWPLVPVVTTLLVLALVGMILLAASSQGLWLHLVGAPTITVTLSPQSHVEQDTYAFTAIPGASTNSATHQVAARLLTSTSPTQSATAPASGSITAKKASGQLTFINETNISVTIQSTIIRDNNGIAITFNGPITIPANPPTVIATGFAVDPGVAGNIPTLDLSKACCAPNNEIFVKNTAFTGGQDAQPNGMIEQKDIDGAANGLVGQLTQGTRAALSKQVSGGERVVDSTVQCQPTINANQHAGDLARSVTVQASVTCSEEVYDYAAVRQLASSQLSARAASDPNLGAAYSLSGQITVNVLSASVTDAANSLTLSVQARGVWAYVFSSQRLHQLAALVAGKSQAEARALLLQQAGIVDAQFSSDNGLPGNVDEIRMVVKVL